MIEYEISKTRNPNSGSPMEFLNLGHSESIMAKSIKIGEGVTFKYNVNIEVRGDFEIGDYSHLGDDVHIRGNNVKIGKHFYHSKGLRVGGGGNGGPNANLTIGNRCTMHNNFINICEPVTICDDVGLSEEVSIITHGYWQSVLEGYPRKFAGVKIGNGVIVGYRSTILPGVEIGENCVIGANSNVTHSHAENGIFAGNPSKFINNIYPCAEGTQRKKATEIIGGFQWEAAEHHGLRPAMEFDFPVVYIDDFYVNLLTFDCGGAETDTTDHFRNYLRKWGIRIYTKRPFHD